MSRRWHRYLLAGLLLLAVHSVLIVPTLGSTGIIATDNGQTTKSIRVGMNPRAIAVNQESKKVYVANYDDGTLSVIDSVTERVIKTISMGAGSSPLKIAVNALTNRVYVTNYVEDSVSVIDGAVDIVSNVVPVGDGPCGIAVNTVTNKIYVANSNSDSVSVIQGLTDTVSTIPIPSSMGRKPSTLVVNSLTDNVYVGLSISDGAIPVIDGASGHVSLSVTAGRGPTMSGINLEDHRLYVTCVDGLTYVVDTETNSIQNRLSLRGAGPLDPNTHKLYFCNGTDFVVTIIDAITNSIQTDLKLAFPPLAVEINTSRSQVYALNNGYPGIEQGSVAIVAATSLPEFYFAEGSCRPGFVPYICIQNPGDVAASVRITYVTGSGSTHLQDISVAAHSRFTALPSDILGTGEDPSHDFSAKVQCTNGRNIIAERSMYFSYQGKWTGGHDVIGAAGPYSRFYFSEGSTRPGFDSYICLQNPTPDETSVNIHYLMGEGENKDHRVILAPQSRTTVSCRDVLGTGDDPAHDFAACVEYDNSVTLFGPSFVAERPMYFNYKGAWTGGSDAVGVTTPASTLYFAEGTTRPEFDCYFSIINTGPEPSADVRVTYMLGDGTTKTQDVRVSRRTTLHPADILGVGDDLKHDFSAKVEAADGQQLVVERPMYFNYKGVWTGGHDVFGISTPSSRFYFAEGTCRPDFDTYFCVQNPGASDADVKITYMKGDATTKEQTLKVDAHSRSTVSCREVLGTGDDAAHDFSAKVECTNGQQIVVERPMYFNYKGVWSGGHNVMGYQE